MSSAYTLMTRLRSPAMSAVLAIMCLQSPAAGGAPFANLRVGVPVENPAYRLGTSTVVQGFVENEGPDPSEDGELFVYISRPVDVSGGMKSDPSKTVGAGGTLCSKDPGYATQAHCHFDRLYPGERMYVLVRVKIEPTMPNWDYQSDSVTFRASSKTPGWNQGNTKNESQQRIIFCHSTKSSLAGCKTAK